MLKFSNRNLLSSIDDLRSQSALIKLCNSPASGVVVYSVDGFESKQPVNADKSWFDKEIYEEITEDDVDLIRDKESDQCHINIIVKQIAPKRG